MLQYDHCKTHRLAAAPNFWKILPKIGPFLGRKSKFLNFLSYPREFPAAGRAGEVDSPNHRILAKRDELFLTFCPKNGNFGLIYLITSPILAKSQIKQKNYIKFPFRIAALVFDMTNGSPTIYENREEEWGPKNLFS